MKQLIEIPVKSIKVEIETIENVDVYINEHLKCLFVLADHLEVLRNGRVVLLQTGDIFLVNPGELVGMVGSSKNKILVLTMKLSKSQRELGNFNLNYPLSLTYYQELYEKITKILASLYIESTNKETGYDYLIEGYIQIIIGLLIRHLPRESVDSIISPEASHITDKNKKIITYINQQYQEKISLQSIADLFFINKFYLAHSFKEQVGISVGNYLKEIRLSNAIRMLDTTEASITEIALTNGFASARSFSSIFKERNGVVPADFRKKKAALLTEKPQTRQTDSYQLLAPYLPDGELTEVKKIELKKMSQSILIDLSSLTHKFQPKEYILKSELVYLTNQSKPVIKALKVRYVAVKDIMQKIVIKRNGNNLEIDFKQLDSELSTIIKLGFIPYLQFQAMDFDDYLKQNNVYQEEFQTLIQRLSYYLQGNYPQLSSWRAEFRCYYEYDLKGELCVPLVDCIRSFEELCEIVIHFPRHPQRMNALNKNTGQLVAIIDDNAAIQYLPLEVAISALEKPEFLENISELKNSQAQQTILQHIEKFEQDDYFHKMSELAIANYTIWYMLNQVHPGKDYYLPISLDATKLFTYFPKNLSEKMALMHQNGLIKESWYAYHFISSLYSEVVYQNEFCILTKCRNNFRLLIAYPEQGIGNFMNKTIYGFPFEKRNKKRGQNPILELSLELQNISGRYKVSQQKLTPQIKKKQEELFNKSSDVKLSFEEIAYYNEVNQPTREIAMVDIEGFYHLDIAVPLLGIQYIELVKVE